MNNEEIRKQTEEITEEAKKELGSYYYYGESDLTDFLFMQIAILKLQIKELKDIMGERNK